MKKCAIHQPNFLPWEGYFHKMNEVDCFVILDNVDIVLGTNKAITNRTKIKTPAGEHWISIPIKKGNSKLIHDIQIMDTNWRDKMLKSLELNYRKSKNFSDFFPVIEKIIRCDSDNLSEYNTHGIMEIAKYLNINTPIFIASELKIHSTDRNERIIEICKKCDCNIYFSGRGGKNYHDELMFHQNEINIHYTNFSVLQYEQLFGDFIPGLSIIDKLFNI
jgi:hypothetical protein